MYKMMDTNTTDVPAKIQDAIHTLINFKDPDYGYSEIDRIIFEKSKKDGIRRLVIYYKSGDWMAIPISED